MATGKTAITEGSGLNVATNTISEDAVTKHLQRTVMNKSDGTEVDFTSGTAGTPAGGVSSVQGVTGMTPVVTVPIPATPVTGLTTAMTGTTSTAVTGVGAVASKFNYITQITVSNSHATVGTDVEIQDGSGGTTFYIIPAAAVYGGATISFPTPLKQPTVNTALYAKNTTTGASTRVSVTGFQAA